MVEHRIGGRPRPRQILRHRRLDLSCAFPQQRLLPGVIPESRVDEKRAKSKQRLDRPRVLHFLRGTVAAGVIGRGVIAQSIGERLDQGRARAAPRRLERLAHHLAHREHIVAVNLHAGNTGGHGFLRQGLCGRLRADRNRNRPAVVDDDEHHGKRTRPGEVERLVEGALGRSTVADIGERAARLLQHLECHRRARRVQRLGGDRYAPGKIMPRHGEIIAAFVAAPVGENFRHGHAPPELRAEFTVHRRQHIFRPHGSAYSNVRGFMAE